MFPKEEQSRVRMTLSFLLEGVVSQRLVATKDGGRIPAVEVMMKTARVSELIAENRDDEILETIENGKEVYGSQSFDQSLFKLYTEKKIVKSTVLRNATSPSDISLKLQGIRQASGQDNLKGSVSENRTSFELK
jgi:twitching motility protein PilT